MWSRLFAFDNAHFSQNVLGNYTLAFTEIFASTGVDKVKHTIDGKEIEHHYFRYQTHWGTMLATFLGLPTRQLTDETMQSWRNLWLNMIAWQPNEPATHRVVNRSLVLVSNVLTIPFTVSGNTLSFVMEFLPLFITKLIVMKALKTEHGINRLVLPTVEYPASASMLSTRVSILLRQSMIYLFFPGLYVPLMLLYLTFRSIRSPIDNVRYLWKVGYSHLGVAGGTTLAVLGGGLSLTAYGLLFYAASLYLSSSILPFLMNHLPTGLYNALIHTLQFISPALTAIAHVAMHVMNLYVSVLTLHFVQIMPLLATTPIAIGLSAVMTLGITTIGTVANRGIEHFKIWWHAHDRPAPSPETWPRQATIPGNSNRTITLTLAAKGKQHAIESMERKASPPATRLKPPMVLPAAKEEHLLRAKTEPSLSISLTRRSS